jgi:hypothetical protein
LPPSRYCRRSTSNSVSHKVPPFRLQYGVPFAVLRNSTGFLSSWLWSPVLPLPLRHPPPSSDWPIYSWNGSQMQFLRECKSRFPCNGNGKLKIRQSEGRTYDNGLCCRSHLCPEGTFRNYVCPTTYWEDKLGCGTTVVRVIRAFAIPTASSFIL